MDTDNKKNQRSFRAGEIIFNENSECDGMYIVKSGQVMVYKMLEGRGQPQEIELTRIGPKGIFGEMALIDQQPRSASVKAITDTTAALITQEMFNQQLSQLPNWVVTMIKLMVSRIRMTNEKLRHALDEQRKETLDDTGGVFVIEGKDDGLTAGQSVEGVSEQPSEDVLPVRPEHAGRTRGETLKISDNSIAKQTELLLQQLDF